MALAKLSSKSQVVLPAAVRKRLGVGPGDVLEIVDEGDRVILRKALSSPLEALDACGSELWQGYDDELQRARDQWDR